MLLGSMLDLNADGRLDLVAGAHTWYYVEVGYDWDLALTPGNSLCGVLDASFKLPEPRELLGLGLSWHGRQALATIGGAGIHSTCPCVLIRHRRSILRQL
jgi:hypothetical protein